MSFLQKEVRQSNEVTASVLEIKHQIACLAYNSVSWKHMQVGLSYVLCAVVNLVTPVLKHSAKQ